MVPNATLERRKRAAVISVATLAVVLSPMHENFRDKPEDGFPLSYFPMFTEQRNAETTLTHPIGIRRDGSEVNLHYKDVAGGGMNQVRRQILRLVGDGDGEQLCERVAQTVARSDRESYQDIVAVAIVKDKYKLERFFNGDRKPSERKVHGRCAVPRATSHEEHR